VSEKPEPPHDQAVQGVKARNADLDADELQAAIDEACATVRSEMWPTSSKAL